MTFLFTDIEGSTGLWERFPAEMPSILERHDELIDRVVRRRGGVVFHRAGDGVIASFDEPRDAADAAIDLQRELAAANWSPVGTLRVRAGLHHGDVVLRDGEPFGWALNFGARFSALGQGGQVLLSEAMADALVGIGTESFGMRRLGVVRLRDIAQPATVFELEGPGVESGFSTLRDTLRPAPLPTPPNPMIGRVDERRQLERRLGTDRLVTVIGPPGVGKSRLVAEVANAVLGSYANGALRCSLAGIDEAQALDVIATSLGVSTRPGRTVDQSLVDWLGDQELLLVLDDCERGGEGLADLVRSIIGSTKSVSVICTSHRPLGVAGEALYRLAPLPIDDAVDLFIDRTASAIPTGGPDSEGLRALCEQLDRLPFSIEVAAAHASLYSVEELRSMLGPRRAGETVGPNAALQSLFDALAMGFQILPTDLRAMLVATSSFADAFDRAAFQEVCAPGRSVAAAAAALTDLVNRSLVTAEPWKGSTRFRLLRGVRDFVEQQGEPAEREAADRRFVDWVLGFIREAATGLRGPDELSWNRRVGLHFDNIRRAFVRSLDTGDRAVAAEICTVLWDYAFMRMNVEYFRWAERLIEDDSADSDSTALGSVYGVAALGAWFRDDLDSATGWANVALQRERDHDLDFDRPARLALLNASIYSGAEAPPADLYAEIVEYERSRDEPYFSIAIDVNNSIMATWLGQRDAAERRGIRAVRVARESGNPSTLAYALWALGSALEVDDPFHAETLLGNSLSIAREHDNLWITALVQMSLASLRRRTSGAIDAAPILLDLLELLSRASHRSHLWPSLRLCGLVLGDLGDDSLAVQLMSWVRSTSLAMPSLPVDDEAARRLEEKIRAERGDDWVDRAEWLTATWTTDSAVAIAHEAIDRHLAAVVAA